LRTSNHGLPRWTVKCMCFCFYHMFMKVDWIWTRSDVYIPLSLYIYDCLSTKTMQQIMIFAYIDLKTCIFTCTPEEYWKDTGQVAEIC
jgi:hypothetical protein